MDSLQWGRLPELGIEEIDREHREILDLMSRLRNVLRAPSPGRAGQEALGSILDEGVSFIQKHFASEETMMQQSLYPGYLDHKKEHELFLGRLLDLRSQMQTGAKMLTLDTLNLMGNWLHHHVLETDKPLVPHLVKAALLEPPVLPAGPDAARESSLQPSKRP